MQRRLLICLTLFSAFALPGCLFWRKSAAKPKPDAAIAAGTEEEFRQRWLDQRSAELRAQGMDATAASAQAETEFRARYNYIGAEKK